MIYQKIEFAKTFQKQFKTLKVSQKERFYERLHLFEQDPSARVLRNHALKGKWAGYRSIDISGDLRALYYIDGEKIVIFAFVGSHSQLY